MFDPFPFKLIFWTLPIGHIKGENISLKVNESKFRTSSICIAHLFTFKTLKKIYLSEDLYFLPLNSPFWCLNNHAAWHWGKQKFKRQEHVHGIDPKQGCCTKRTTKEKRKVKVNRDRSGGNHMIFNYISKAPQRAANLQHVYKSTGSLQSCIGLVLYTVHAKKFIYVITNIRKPRIYHHCFYRSFISYTNV